MVEIDNKAKEIALHLSNLIREYIEESNLARKEEILEQIKAILINSTKDYFEAVANNIVNDALSVVGVGYGYLDKEILEKFFESEIWEDILRNYGERVKERIEDVFRDEIRYIGERRVEIDPRSIMRSLRKIGEITFYEAERVMRSNLHSLYNMALVEGYKYVEREREKRFKWKWVGVNDNRTSDICREIKRIVGDGVDSLEELERIVEEISMKYLGKYGWKYRRGSFLPHPNCRHRVLAILQE